MAEPGGRDLLREWQDAMQSVVSSAASVAGRAELPRQLLAPMIEVQADLFERAVKTLREPAELAKTAAGVQRRPARARRGGKR